jgi:tetratricopeptide (TPR) repeat protein
MLKEMHVKRVAQLGIALAAALVMGPGNGAGQTAAAKDDQGQTAFALEQQGKNAEAETAWRAFLQSHPANAEAYAHLGFLEARQERYTEAVPLYRKALALNPAMPGLRLNLGLSLFKSGSLKEAVQTFTPLLKSQPPSSPEALRLTALIGLAHYGLGDYAAAVPFLKQASVADPQNLAIRLAWAHSCLWSKQYQCVLDVYHEILTLNAESAEADMLAGEALDEMKDNEGSVKMFRAAVKADPKEPNVHFALGYLLWTQKKYPEAMSEFRAELANDPEHVQATLYLADTDVQISQMDAARPLLEKVVAANPALALGHLDLGIVLSSAGHNEDALRQYLAAASITPNDVNVHWRLAQLYRSMGKREEAKAEFDKASTLTKAADEELYKKIANGRAKPPETPAGTPANP